MGDVCRPIDGVNRNRTNQVGIGFVVKRMKTTRSSCKSMRRDSSNGRTGDTRRCGWPKGSGPGRSKSQRTESDIQRVLPSVLRGHGVEMEIVQRQVSMMTARIDSASPDDADVIASMVGELLHEIMAAVSVKAFNFDHHDTEARARTWLSDGSYLALLARIGGVAVGCLALYQSYALYTEGIYGTIPEFYVRPSHRSQGIGTALIAESMKVAQARGWRRLEVTTPPLPQFNRTLAFYQRHGFSISGGRKMKLELS